MASRSGTSGEHAAADASRRPPLPKMAAEGGFVSFTAKRRESPRALPPCSLFPCLLSCHLSLLHFLSVTSLVDPSPAAACLPPSTSYFLPPTSYLRPLTSNDLPTPTNRLLR